MTEPTYTVPVADDKAGTRLDKLLAASVPALSRARLQALIHQGCVAEAVTGIARDPSKPVRCGEVYHIAPPPLPPARPEPEAIPLTVVYEDDHVIVIDKPAGLVVHPGAGNRAGTLVNALLAHCGGQLSSIGAPDRPGIVHRLDKDTSGLLVAAKTDGAHHDLARQFAEHTVDRAYAAVVWGHPKPASGRMTSQIGRSARDRTQMAVVPRGGKLAITQYETLRPLGGWASLLRCRLATGRTHQIRVHLAFAGHPLVGDPVYRARPRSGRSVGTAASMAGAALPLQRQALHAILIGFTHPSSGQRLRFRVDLPRDINELINFLETV
jgi:23S rRNA pseudouridine1911/1915/1917 synthase